MRHVSSLLGIVILMIAREQWQNLEDDSVNCPIRAYEHWPYVNNPWVATAAKAGQQYGQTAKEFDAICVAMYVIHFLPHIYLSDYLTLYLSYYLSRPVLLDVDLDRQSYLSR